MSERQLPVSHGLRRGSAYSELKGTGRDLVPPVHADREVVVVLSAWHGGVCGLYTPGHQVHFIQAKKSWEDHPAKYRHGSLVAIEDDGWITVLVDGETLRFWNHDPARARDCFAASEGRVGLPGWSLLHAPHGGGLYCICVSTDGATPCLPLRHRR